MYLMENKALKQKRVYYIKVEAVGIDNILDIEYIYVSLRECIKICDKNDVCAYYDTH